MNRRLSRDKRGYFFLLDAFLALSAILIGVFLLLSFRAYQPQQVQPLVYAEDVMEVLSANAVADISNTSVSGGSSAVGLYVQNLLFAESGNPITNTENTLLEQIAEYYVMGRPDRAMGFAINITQNAVPDRYGLELHVNRSDLVIPIQEGLFPANESQVLVSSKRLTAGVINRTFTWGPMLMEARVWI